ncbi:MAG: UDP-N-acetylglucosamine 2-epimerase (non-hydrolyzing) [Flavobacteriales bacterium]|jgi:UDP-N-acetylglucosamine 2-epimerase (non-hydrolysing)|uniref:non-hydrolyzing UDP-N-acetylglucosamine 2-epimerase n=1 Tax=Candidatus Ulvibacter alkanivorans TaxID=2267620 RepID=UPI000DF4C4AF|nr:UDP-N-acetylglucosamine 2-epimerase (non-hydrolyzing) [Candidatus Ulvibacter alkanivorans]MCH2489915.1 UDP-N-acetylglucosamine 2-epimerase (non-hydrolyzing) [Flavobacteriales bacterium]
MKITLVAGARPNFMKIAPIIHEIERRQQQGVSLSYRLIHTGQHYDKNLSDTFFEELNIPKPNDNLDVKSGSQAAQTGAIMVGFEKELAAHPCDLVLVVGDVTSTMACTIVAKKAHIPVTHVEAGIRSGDMKMPEEINRIVTDSITDYFFTTSQQASDHLKSIGKPTTHIFFVGNVMIDTLLHNLNRLQQPSFWDELKLSKNKYFVLTLHRPSNVDGLTRFTALLSQIMEHAKGAAVVFPVHPRTQKILQDADLSFPNLHYVSPQGYLSFIYLVKHAKAVLTDSGGITEEASVLNIPCITFRDSTERPETCELGTNMLVGNDPKKIDTAFELLASGNWPKSQHIPKWDGKAAKRILDHILSLHGN